MFELLKKNKWFILGGIILIVGTIFLVSKQGTVPIESPPIDPVVVEPEPIKPEPIVIEPELEPEPRLSPEEIQQQVNEIQKQVEVLQVEIEAQVASIVTDFPVEESFGGITPYVMNEPNNADLVGWAWDAHMAEENGETVRVTHTKIGQINYLGENEWLTVDTRFATSSDGTRFGVTETTAPIIAGLRSIDPAVMHNNKRWDIPSRSLITEAPLDMSITALGVNDVAGKIVRGNLLIKEGIAKDVSYVLYENAWTDTDLIYYVHQGMTPILKKMFCMKAKPTTTYSFELQYSDKVNFGQIVAQKNKEWDEIAPFLFEQGKPISVKRDGGNRRGISMGAFKIWDNDMAFLDGITPRNIATVDVGFQKTGLDKIKLTKDPRPFFDNPVVYPVCTDGTFTDSPDADPETNTFDGQLESTQVDATISVIVAEVGVASIDNATTFRIANLVASATTDQYSILRRGELAFPTGESIPSTDTLNEATVHLNGSSKEIALGGGGNDNSKVVVVEAKPTNQDVIDNSDFEKMAWIDFGLSVIQDNWTNTGYNEIVLNSDGIAYMQIQITAATSTRLGTKYVWDNSTTTTGITWVQDEQNHITIDSADTAGSASDPLLISTTTAAEVAVPVRTFFFGLF